MPIYRNIRDPRTALEHLQGKLAKTLSAEDARLRAREVLTRGDGAEPLLVGEDRLLALPAEVRKRLERAKQAHLEVFHRTHPLLAGEQLVREWCGVLAEGWRDYPAGSAAVVRETSICREIHVFPYLRLHDGELREGEAVEVGAEGKAKHMLFTLALDPTSIVGDLYLGLVKGALDKATTALFEYLFPPGPPAWMKEVYTRIQGIVHGEIQAAKLGELEGKLRACSTHVHDYNAFHQEKPAEAVGYLKQAYDLCLEVTSELEVLGDPAAAMYCVAVAQWFLIMQELARIDPDHAGAPLGSTWSTLIRERAPHAAEHAEACRKSIIATRLKRVSACREQLTFDSDVIYYFRDDETGYVWKKVKGCTSKEARECAAAREAYYRSIEAQTTDKVKDIAGLVAAATELAAHPLPTLAAG